MKPTTTSLQPFIVRYLPFVVFALYLALTLLITYPLVFQLTTHFAGVSDNDSREFIWSTWWFKKALLEQGSSPININILNHPDGLTFPLLPLMSQSFIISLPLALLVSPAFAFNITYLLSFPLCALAGYWLCYDLTHDRRAAFVGGLIWGFFPNKAGHALAGHLFQLVVFTLPIAILFLLRLFRAPSWRNAIGASVSLFVASTIHPVNIAYFLLPTCVVLTAFYLYEQWANLQSLISHPKSIIANYKFHLVAVLLAALLILPLFLPTLTGAQTGQLGFLIPRGVSEYAVDVLSFFIPSYDHPLIKGSALYDLAHRILVFPLETNAYLGYVPLLLAALGVWWRWRDNSKKWLTLFGLTALLALGPLLRFNGMPLRVKVDVEYFPILMPYALVANLPFFEWSRTPARLMETVIFALMILAAYGVQGLLPRLRWRGLAWAVFIAICGVIPFEYLVRFPLPTTPIEIPQGMIDLAKDKSFVAVMNYPVPENTVNLYALLQQTYHQHPVIGGRVYRDQPDSENMQRFLSGVVTPPEQYEIALSPTPEQRLMVLNYFGVGRIVHQPLGDPHENGRKALNNLLGAPVVEDKELSIYKVPPLAPSISQPFFILGDNWDYPESWGDSYGRWFRDVGTVYIFSGDDRAGSLKFTAIPGQNLRQMVVKVNGDEVAQFAVGDWAVYQTPTIRLRQGLNAIQFVDLGGHWQFTGDPRCRGGSPVAGPFPMKVECDTGNRDTRNLSLVIKDLSLVPEAASLTVRERFGVIELISVAAPKVAKPGETILFNMRWRTTRPLDRDYTLFVQLLDTNGNYVAGADAQPARGDHPTSRWRTNELVAYNVPLPIPANVPAGQYSLILGWYEWPSLDRIPLENGSNALNVGMLEITR